MICIFQHQPSCIIALITSLHLYSITIFYTIIHLKREAKVALADNLWWSSWYCDSIFEASGITFSAYWPAQVNDNGRKYLDFSPSNEDDEWRFGKLSSSSIDSAYNQPNRTTFHRLSRLKTGLESDQQLENPPPQPELKFQSRGPNNFNSNNPSWQIDHHSKAHWKPYRLV